jgi:hypothetical protein
VPSRKPLCGQRVWALPDAPGQVAALTGFGVFARGDLEAGQAGGRRQPQPIGEWLSKIGGRGTSRVKVIMP